jgi:hypothetical protein
MGYGGTILIPRSPHGEYPLKRVFLFKRLDNLILVNAAKKRKWDKKHVKRMDQLTQ